MVRSRTTVRASGESRGEHPHWQAVWRMCLHTLHFSTFPPSWKEGGQGNGPRPYRGQSPEPRESSGGWRRGPALRWRWWCPQCMKRGVQRGAPPLAGGLEDVPPYTTLLHFPPFLEGRGPGGWCGPALRSVQAGESRGEHPHWQAVWRMCLHKRHFFTIPPSFQEGGQGDGAVPHYGAYKRGVQRGAPPLAGGMEDVPPYTTLLHFPPFLEGRGPGGWCGPALRCVQAGSPEGAPPLAGGMEDVPPYTTLLYYPPSWKEGGQGDGAVPHYGAYKRGVQRGAPPLAGGMEDVPPYTALLHFPPFLPGRGPGGWCGPALRCVQAGESRGEHPHWQAVWRMCLHTLRFFTFPPFLEGRGPGGWSAPLSRPKPRTAGVKQRVAAWPSTTVAAVVPQCMKRGSPEGSTPSGRLHGIPRYNEGWSNMPPTADFPGAQRAIFVIGKSQELRIAAATVAA